MKKFFRIILKISIVLFVIIGVFIGVFILSQYISRKQLETKMTEKLAKCELNLYVTERPEVRLYNFNDKSLNKIEFQILRDGQSIKDTVLIGTTNKDHITRIKIPFKKFLKTDTILLVIDDTLYYYISDFHYSVNMLYGMFGPVAISDCSLSNSYTINDNKYVDKIDKFYGRLRFEQNKNTQRISSKNRQYEKLTETYKINVEQADSICRLLNAKHNKSGSGIEYGLEINKSESYYLRGIFNEEDKIEIVKINTRNGELIDGLKNYPIENKYYKSALEIEK